MKLFVLRPEIVERLVREKTVNKRREQLFSRGE
jgi:hypothetical protein